MAIRVDGIMSGLDTESLVKLQVSHLQSQIDRLVKQKTNFTWQRERYHSVYNTINTYRTSFYDFKLDGTTKIKSATTTNNAVSVKANADAKNGSHTIEVNALATYAQTGSSSALGSNGVQQYLKDQLGITNPNLLQELEFKLNGKTIKFDPSTEGIYDFVDKINSSGAGVTASYDANLDRVFIKSDKTGADAKVDFSETAVGAGARNFLQNWLKLDIDAPNPSLNKGVYGTDAEFVLDGVAIKQASNEFTFEGATYTLNEVTEPNKPVIVKIADDLDAVYNSLVSFVDLYNDLLDILNGTIYETKNKGYEALTDDEKSELTADQIEKLEDLAKAGILRGDSTLKTLVSDMRSIIYSTVSGIDGPYNSLVSIGVKTTNWSELGRLSIDEDKVRAALGQDPEIVNKLLNGGRDKDGNRTDGIADKLYDRLKVAMDDIDTKSGVLMGDNDVNSYLAKRINSLEKSISRKTDRLNAMMESYYKQYDYLEQMLYQMQSQQEALYNYLG